jgi:hypothetical protein
MTPESPPTRRKFKSLWDEIDYLYHKLLYWFYQRDNPRRARRFAGRLERLLKRAAASDPEAIFGEGARALVCELKGDLAGAIEHREKEIRLIGRLHEISLHTPSEADVLRAYGFDDLSDRLDLLAILHHEAGDLDRAIGLLEESKELCRAHRIPFDAQDVLNDYLAEKKAGPGEAPARNRPPQRRKRSAG